MKTFIEDENAPRKIPMHETESLDEFLDNAPVPMHFVNGSGIIIWANQAELNMLGYSREEFINKHISSFHADKDIIEDIMQRLINKETLKYYPARLICKNGEIKEVYINSNVYRKNDEFIHTRCFTLERCKTDENLSPESQVQLLQQQDMPVK